MKLTSKNGRKFMEDIYTEIRLFICPYLGIISSSFPPPCSHSVCQHLSALSSLGKEFTKFHGSILIIISSWLNFIVNVKSM